MKINKLKTKDVIPQEKLTTEHLLRCSDLEELLSLYLPSNFAAAKFIAAVRSYLKSTTDLLKVDKMSFLYAMFRIAHLGLDPSPLLDHVYFIPFNTKNGTKEVKIIISYKGLIELALRSPNIVSISADCVRENDIFSVKKGTSQELEHIPDMKKNRGKIIAAYAICRFKSGMCEFEAMSVDEINNIAKHSYAEHLKFMENKNIDHEFKKNNVWLKHWDQMAKKTVIRRLFKYLSINDQLTKAIRTDEVNESNDENYIRTFNMNEIEDIFQEDAVPEENKIRPFM